MKKLGLIVGVGPETTVAYYRGIVYGMQKRLARAIVPPMSMENLSTYEVLRMTREGDLDGLTEYLLEGIGSLARGGAQVGAITCNTGHIVFDRLRERSPIPLVSIVEASCRTIVSAGYSRVILLGTPVTMESGLYREPLQRAGIDVIVPDAGERTWLAGCIEHELGIGQVRDSAVCTVVDMIGRLRRENAAEAVVLGCTELPLLFAGRSAPLPLIDTVQAHVDVLIEEMLRDDSTS